MNTDRFFNYLWSQFVYDCVDSGIFLLLAPSETFYKVDCLWLGHIVHYLAAQLSYNAGNEQVILTLYFWKLINRDHHLLMTKSFLLLEEKLDDQAELLAHLTQAIIQFRNIYVLKDNI